MLTQQAAASTNERKWGLSCAPRRTLCNQRRHNEKIALMFFVVLASGSKQRLLAVKLVAAALVSGAVQYATMPLTFVATTPCSRLNLGPFCGAETALLAWWCCEMYDDETAVGLCHASTWGHVSIGHASRRGFPRRSRCCICSSLLLLLQMLLLHEGTRAADDVPEHVARQRSNAVSNRQKSDLGRSRRKLGQSKTSGEFSANRRQWSYLISLVFGSTLICFPNMVKLVIFLPIRVGFVMSRR